MASSSNKTDLVKRTRTNVHQSKYGCFTCKARKIKCDEAKPACRRCLTSKRECQGYPHAAPPFPSSTAFGSLAPTSAAGLPLLTNPIAVTQNPITVTSPFIHLARAVFVQSPRRARSAFEMRFWSHTVPQLTHTIPSVRAAVEAFGASYQEYVLRAGPPGDGPGPESIKSSSRAVRLVQQDLATMKHGPIPCIIACLFLASAEVVQQQLERAHWHLLGAFSVLTSHMDPDKKAHRLADIDMDDLSLLLQKLDLHISPYTIPLPPNLPPFPPIATEVLASSPSDWSLLNILHSSQHFTSKAFLYKYTSARLTPPELLIEQGRQLSSLKQWLALNQVSYGSSTLDESLAVMRCQCLAAMIFTANILEPRETAYDCYGPEFEEIVTLIEAVMQSKDKKNLTSLPSFIPELGIIQPLYFTAQRYRNRFWRRKALGMILNCGKEGPWDGATEGSVIAAFIRNEELLLERVLPMRMNNIAHAKEDSIADSASNIPEECRVNSCWTIDPPDGQGECSRITGKRYTDVILHRCLDLDGCLRDEGQGPRRFPWEDSGYWEQWEEKLEPVI